MNRNRYFITRVFYFYLFGRDTYVIFVNKVKEKLQNYVIYENENKKNYNNLSKDADFSALEAAILMTLLILWIR